MSNATGSSRRTTAYPTIVPYPQRRSQSAHDRSFYWFRHACCIPTTSVLWMIVVLFLFAVILLAICCFSLFLTRWIYLRQIRKKAEVIRQKYKKEDDIRRESDLRLREIALKRKCGS
ncbi:hypothetical protein Q1695_014454 [Nippostrongylus brasiliensis]|nr:hypothetical protein Q1695_014454 [Nippostrongylus brasiliensis]